jgi:TPR repeat protein
MATNMGSLQKAGIQMKLRWYFVLLLVMFAMSGCKRKTAIADHFREVSEKNIADPQISQDIKEKTKLALGMSYILENKKDIPRGVALIKGAAESGNAVAQEMLGGYYAQGFGVQKDTAQAIEWYTKAAAQGNQKAKDELLKIQEVQPAASRDKVKKP